jgi:NADH dehydrogenase FAD-containing subunit
MRQDLSKIADSSLKKDLNAKGQFQCKPTLQLQNCDTVFACGDILVVPEGCFADVKGLQHADDTAEQVGKNVVHLLEGKPLQNFSWSKTPIQKPMISSLGTKVGIGFMGMPNFMENFMARSFKCKDYYMSIKGSIYGKGKTW